jgi:PAS domain-containing protein
MNTRIWNIAGIVLIAVVIGATALVPGRSAYSELAIALAGFGVLSVFYLLHLVIHQRSVHDLVEKAAEMQSSLQQVNEKKAELEGKLAERTKESESVLQSTIDGISDPVLFIDTDYRVTMSNEAARKAFDVEVDSEEAVYCYRAMHGLDAPCDADRRSGQGHSDTRGRRGSETPCRDPNHTVAW